MATSLVSDSLWLWVLLALCVFNGFLLLALLLRKPGDAVPAALLGSLAASNERLERELRHDINESARNGRQELGNNLASFQQALVLQSAEATRTQNSQIDAFGQQLALLQKTLSDTLTTQLQNLSESNARRIHEVRATLETQLAQLQQTNIAKLDEMRKTVDEKLQHTLETRLGESFKQVADRLEQGAQGPRRDAEPCPGGGRPAAGLEQREDARHVWRGATGSAAGTGADRRAVRQTG